MVFFKERFPKTTNQVKRKPPAIPPRCPALLTLGNRNPNKIITKARNENCFQSVFSFSSVG